MVYRAEVASGETSGTVEVYYTDADDIKAATTKVLSAANKKFGKSENMRVKKIEEVPGLMAA